MFALFVNYKRLLSMKKLANVQTDKNSAVTAQPV